MNEPNDNDLNSAMENLPMAQQAPTELKQDLLRLARQTPNRRISKWPSIPTIAFAGVAAVAIVVALTLTPTHAAAKTWSLIRKAVDSVTSTSLVVNTVDHGKTKTVQVAMSGGKVAVVADDTIVTIDGGHIKVYGAKTNTIRDIVLPAGGVGKEISDGISQGLAEGIGQINVKSMFADFERKYGKENIKVSQPETLNGAQVYRVVLTDPNDGKVVHMIVDAKANLPKHIEVDDAQGKSTMSMDLEFNSAVDAKLLNPQFPKDAKVDREDISKMGFNFSGAGKHGFGGFGDSKVDINLEFGDEKHKSHRGDPGGD